MADELDRIIKRSLGRFVKSISDARWKGREREAISYYAFGFLQKARRSGSAFYSPTQIGIETAVPGLRNLNSKTYVNKDLVIWRKDGMNLWNPKKQNRGRILAIMEWKVYRRGNGRLSDSREDAHWLKAFVDSNRSTIGYAVTISLGKIDYRCMLSVFRHGKCTEKFFWDKTRWLTTG